jgi:hypothetical protein
MKPTAASSLRQRHRPLCALLLALSACTALACDDKPATPGSSTPATTTPAASASAAPKPVAPKVPDVLVDEGGAYIGGERVDFKAPDGAKKLAAIMEKHAAVLAGKDVTLTALRAAKTPDVVRTVSALAEKAKTLHVKTQNRDKKDATITVVPDDKAGQLPDCTVTMMVLKDRATASWHIRGGVATKYAKGMAGPDMSQTAEGVAKQWKTCAAGTALVLAGDDSVEWGLVFDLSQMADPRTTPEADRVFVLPRTTPIAGRAVKIGDLTLDDVGGDAPRDTTSALEGASGIGVPERCRRIGRAMAKKKTGKKIPKDRPSQPEPVERVEQTEIVESSPTHSLPASADLATDPHETPAPRSVRPAAPEVPDARTALGSGPTVTVSEPAPSDPPAPAAPAAPAATTKSEAPKAAATTDEPVAKAEPTPPAETKAAEKAAGSIPPPEPKPSEKKEESPEEPAGEEVAAKAPAEEKVAAKEAETTQTKAAETDKEADKLDGRSLLDEHLAPKSTRAPKTSTSAGTETKKKKKKKGDKDRASETPAEPKKASAAGEEGPSATESEPPDSPRGVTLDAGEEVHEDFFSLSDEKVAAAHYAPEFQDEEEAKVRPLTASERQRRDQLRRIVIIVVGTAAAACLMIGVRLSMGGNKHADPPALDPSQVVMPAAPAPKPEVSAEPEAAPAATATATATGSADAAAAPSASAAAMASAEAAPSASAAAAPAASASAAPTGGPVDAEEAKKMAKVALRALESGNNKGAVEKSSAAVDADPTDAAPYLYWGTALMNMGKMADAKKVFQTCVDKATHGPKNDCRQFR